MGHRVPPSLFSLERAGPVDFLLCLYLCAAKSSSEVSICAEEPGHSQKQVLVP